MCTCSWVLNAQLQRKERKEMALTNCLAPGPGAVCGVRSAARQCQDPEVGVGWKGPEWVQGPGAWPAAQQLQEGGSSRNSDELG